MRLFLQSMKFPWWRTFSLQTSDAFGFGIRWCQYQHRPRNKYSKKTGCTSQDWPTTGVSLWCGSTKSFHCSPESTLTQLTKIFKKSMIYVSLMAKYYLLVANSVQKLTLRVKYPLLMWWCIRVLGLPMTTEHTC